MKSADEILILGFPSDISKRVASLLLDAGKTVYMLVSPEQFSSAAPLKKKFGKHLQLLSGRGDQLDFGMSGPDYLQLAGTVQHVLVLYSFEEPKRLFRFYDALVRELVEFCKAARRLKRLTCLSNFSFATGFDGLVAENDLTLPMPQRAQTSQPAYRLERVLSRFRITFPIFIVRTGTLVGNTDSLCPVVMLALAYPEQFTRSKSARMLFSSMEDVAGFLVESLAYPSFRQTVHLFNEMSNARKLGVELTRMALSQVQPSFDLRKAAQQRIRSLGYDVKRLSALQTHACVENAWTNHMFEEHNFSKWNHSLNWEPLVDYTVEKLTGFR